MFLKVALTWIGWPCPALDVGLLIEVTTRSGDSRMVIAPAAVVQLLASLISATSLASSAQASTLYVPGFVSEYTLSATPVLSLTPGASGPIVCTPFKFFLVVPTTSQNLVVVDTPAGARPWFVTTEVIGKGSPARAVAGGSLIDTTRSGLSTAKDAAPHGFKITRPRPTADPTALQPIGSTGTASSWHLSFV